MKFDMDIKDNFASFKDEDGVVVLIDSFDNVDFEVRIGTMADSQLVGTVKATTSSEINQGIFDLYTMYKGV